MDNQQGNMESPKVQAIMMEMFSFKSRDSVLGGEMNKRSLKFSLIS